MKHVPSKADVRDEIERQIQDFLGRGGEVEEVRQGTSGLNTGEPHPSLAFDRPKQDRTPLPDVVAAIDARKNTRNSDKKNTTKAKKRPRKKIIYDDFGEPLREVWVED